MKPAAQTITTLRVDQPMSDAAFRALEQSHPFAAHVHRTALARGTVQPHQVAQALLECADRGAVPASTLGAILTNAARMITGLHQLLGVAEAERQALVDQLAAPRVAAGVTAGRVVESRSAEVDCADDAGPLRSLDPPDRGART